MSFDRRVFEAKGYLVVPGFVDLHTHLREPGFEDSETIETGRRAALRGGFTTICAMPNTEPAVDSPGLLKELAVGAQAGEAELGEAGLSRPEELALTADLEVLLRQLEAVVRGHERLESRLGRVRQRVLGPGHEQAVRLLRAPPHSAA